MDADSTSGLYGVFLPTVLMYVRDSAASKKLADKVTPSQLPEWRNGWYRDLLAYQRQDITAASLLDKAGSSQWNLCEAHYVIGLREYASGAKDNARSHFKLAVETNTYHYFAFQWSRALLEQINQNPNQ